MDFLDPIKVKQQKVILYIGYFFITVLIGLATIIFLYLVKGGYTISSGGKVYQNGLVFLSSQPHPADIYLNGKLNSATTNKHIYIPEGIYSLSLQRNGYRPWNKSIEIEGGEIFYADYPLLVPNILSPHIQKTYNAAPNLFTQSLDHKYLVVGKSENLNSFDVYNISNPKNVTLSEVTIPDSLLTNPSQAASYSVISWADDNQHVLLNRNYSGGSEYLELDILNASKSINLSKTLSGLSYTSLSLVNLKYDQLYLYNQNQKTLEQINITDPTTIISSYTDVNAFSTYQANTLLYSTADTKDNTKEDIYVSINDQKWLIKKLPAGGEVLLDLATYNNVPYVVIGDSLLNKVYVYKDPVSQIKTSSYQDPVPSQVLAVKNPNYVKFSTNAQFVLAENNTQFGVYDILNDHGYNYNSKFTIDAPQQHAEWMDGYRITYVSSAKVVIFEYDNHYPQTLTDANSNYSPQFDGTNTYYYDITSSDNKYNLVRTSLYTPSDQP